MFQYAKQPLPIVQIWKYGIDLYKTTFTKVWYWILPIVLIRLVTTSMLPILYSSTFFKSHSYMFIIYGNIALFIFLLIEFYFYLISLNRIHQLAINSNEPLQNALKAVHKKCWPCLLNFLLLYAFMTILSMIFACIFALMYALKTDAAANIGLIVGALIAIPSIIFGLSWAFDWPLILFENNTALAAIKNGIKLIWRKFWRTILGLGVPLLIPCMAITSLYYLASYHPQSTVLASTNIIISAGIVLLLMPLFLSLILVQFNDLKLRKQAATPAAPTTTPSTPQ
jgi:hypothetical protein